MVTVQNICISLFRRCHFSTVLSCLRGNFCLLPCRRLFYNRLESDCFRDFGTLLHSVFLERLNANIFEGFRNYTACMLFVIFLYYFLTYIPLEHKKRNKSEYVKINFDFRNRF